MNGPLKIYGFDSSHPCEAVLAAARQKQVEVEFIEIPPALHRLIMPFIVGGNRVPGARYDGKKYRGTTEIFHLLDEIEPAQPLFPSDPDLRGRVEEAEAWGEGEIQDVGRRLAWAHLSRSTETVKTWAGRGPDGIERRIKIAIAPFLAQVAKYGNRATDDNVRADLEALPGYLDQIDGYVEEGTIGGDEPNAADFQILSTVGMWLNLADLREDVMARPCGPPAARLFPNYDGRIPGGLLPDDWFAPMRARVPSGA